MVWTYAASGYCHVTLTLTHFHFSWINERHTENRSFHSSVHSIIHQASTYKIT